ncbi:amidohydrolase family protein [Histidinibacterium aquaticum]|uniref:Amidohydrolase n=1 Tax=Histidinibacterium aquaticum TaxID=2613962 RepID=A0A5J5GGD2_9RHOB|nr:amidohydrolase family protein [Histidinibacterium aquaticum]KAA9006788.1 amidohydrolase [Histidinibacterium aquaticum]
MAGTPEFIAIEEHFMEPSLAQYLGKAASPPAAVSEKLYDFFERRIPEMDAAGVTKQVLSHQSPGSQRLADDVAEEACRNVNDALADVIAQAPDRFDGFAMLPTNLPEAAADELTRAVEEKGLKGAMVHGLNHGEFLDAERYRPIFARAEALDVPIYIHPSLPDKTVTERYYAPFDQTHHAMTRAGWGFGVEAGTQAVRLILSGIFDEHPNLKIVLGHLGEAIPYLLVRMDEAFSRDGNRPVNFAEVFRRNFWVTTSGFFSDSALRCCLDELGPDRILFAVDYPYVGSKPGVDWLKAYPMDEAEKAKIASGNAKDLLKL